MLMTLETVLLATYLGVSVALFTTSIVLAILHYYRVIHRTHINQYNNCPIINHVLLQQPPLVHLHTCTPIPSRRASTLDEHPRLIHRRNKEDLSGEMEIGVQEGSNGGSAGARLPFIQLSTDDSSHHANAASHTPYHTQPAPAADAADLARYLIRLGLGNTGPRGSPVSERPSLDHPRSTRVPDSPADSTFELSILWDDLNLPYTAFFPR